MENTLQVFVLGASLNPDKYSYMASSLLKSKGHQVHAIGQKKGFINDISIETTRHQVIENLHTITLYLPPKNQKPYYDYIIQLKPQRVIFNPGTENPELYALLNQNNIPFEEACTLVLLSTNQF
jgi:predicted CoA-binding protein